MRTYYILITVILLSLPAMFFWLASDRLQEFVQTHQKIASNSTNHISNAVTQFIDERKRLVSTFADYNGESLKRLLEDSTDDILINEINENFIQIFPNFISFTLADKTGKVLLDDFDGHIGNLCRQDIEIFSKTKRQLPRVHPNTEKYHFDIMVNINNDNNILFVSFDADLLGSIVQTAQIPEHNFMLTFPIDENLLIEVTKKGSRQHITNRDNYLLTEHEQNRLLYKRNMTGTSWQVADLHSVGLFTNYKNKMIENWSIVYAVFLLIIVALTFLMRREEKLKINAEQMRYEFIGVVSHELRTPLTSIKGSLGLVANEVTGPLPEQALTMVKMALSNCDRLIDLVNDLLDIQKMESGKISLDKKNTNLSTLIRQAITDAEAYGSKFSVNYQLIDLLPDTFVNVDEARMFQVMNNLLSNAAKYGKKNDTVDISIIAYRGNVRLSITDNGNGIAIELQNNVFEKFSQGKTTENTEVKSTGLGLHIVKKIIELHGGEIDFYSSKNGTTFFIDLPIAKVQEN